MTHSPTDRPRLVVAADGTLAAVSEPARVVVVDLPGAELVSEIGLDRTADDVEVAWLGTPPRLLVLSRYATHTTVHLLDPHGPESIAEIQLASPVTLCATVGVHALVLGAQGAAVVSAGEAHLTPYQFPARAKPTVAGAAGNQFVVAIPGVIEEWDPQARVPKRRLRLPRPTTITAVGGSERVVWMVTQQEPARIDVLPLINRGQPKTHDLPEPIAAIAGHPKSDLLACIGASSGRAYAIDLDGRTRLRSLAFPHLDRLDAIGLVVGRTTGVVAAQRGRPITFVPLEARDAHVASPIVVPTHPLGIDEPAPADGADEPPRVSSSLVENLVDAAMNIASKVSAAAASTGAPAPTSATPSPSPEMSSPARMNVRIDEAAPTAASATGSGKTAKNLAARFAAVRERREAALAATASAAPAAPRAAASAPSIAASSIAVAHIATRPDIAPSESWRDDVVAWAREIVEARGAEREATPLPPPLAQPIDELATRFALSFEIVPALAVLYGAHLAGHDGVAPADLARVLDRRWHEALGRGDLAASGVATYERSRVRLATAVLRVLDELLPATGTLVGTPGSVALLGSCVVVDRAPALDIAARHAARAGGAILVGHHDHGVADICFEARAFGAVAMLPASKLDAARSPVIYVADDEDEAARLGLPRFA